MNYLFTSQRLGFRNWVDTDLVPFAQMNADAAVMEFFPGTLTKEDSDQLLRRLQMTFEQNGFTFFAVDLLETKEFLGFIGLLPTSFEADFTPCVEIGWRLKKTAWGKGYATEGALRCLEFADETLGIKEIYSFTPTLNTKSEQVMKKIGMRQVKTFKYPKLAKNHVLQPHFLYRKYLS